MSPPVRTDGAPAAKGSIRMGSITIERQGTPDATPPGVAIVHRHSGEVLYRIDSATLRGATLDGAALFGADLDGADLRGADLSGASLLGATLCRSRLDDANLHRATLYGADLADASLRRADLRRTDLRAANLSGADLAGALLCGARYNPDTQWPCPEGTRFDPHAYGAVAVRRRSVARGRSTLPAPAIRGEVLIVEDDD